MDLEAGTVHAYIDHVYAGIGTVLDRHDDTSVNQRPGDWGTNSVAGLVVHCCELTPSWFELPGLGRDSHRDRDQEFVTTATVEELRARITRTLTKTHALIDEFFTGPTTPDHPFRVFLPDGDISDPALIIHVFEELFQHLGHMEVLSDALKPGSG